MKVFDLRCGQEHGFEGWFGSEDDYVSQQARGLVACPVCGDTTVVRTPSAPRLNLSGATARSSAARSTGERDGRGGASGGAGGAGNAGSGGAGQGVPQAAEARAQLQAIWMKAVRHVMANTEDVGGNFAEEARKIHYNEAPERSIRGTASREETEALADEGIDVLPLPLPDGFKDTLQ